MSKLFTVYQNICAIEGARSLLVYSYVPRYAASGGINKPFAFVTST